MKSTSSARGRVLPVVTFHNETRLFRILAASLLVLAMMVTGAALAQTSSNTDTSPVVETGSDTDSSEIDSGETDSSEIDVGDDQAERSAGDRRVAALVMPIQTGSTMPANARMAGNGWRSLDGYRLADGTDGAPPACTAVQPPAYAVKVANGWACVSGYVRNDQSCIRITAPSYGYIRAGAVICHAGFALDDSGACVAFSALPNTMI